MYHWIPAGIIRIVAEIDRLARITNCEYASRDDLEGTPHYPVYDDLDSAVRLPPRFPVVFGKSSMTEAQAKRRFGEPLQPQVQSRPHGEEVWSE